MLIFNLIKLLLLFLNSNVVKSDDKLVFLWTHFRHGARAPQNIDDNYLDLLGEKWTTPGELTPGGQRMHFILGLRNRIRYITEKKFLDEKFNPHEILIYSSYFNRTLISASAQLQGLYPESAGKGDILSQEQEESSYPPLNVDYEEIEEEIKNLNGYALPNSMMLAPTRMINQNERKILLFDSKECINKRNEIRSQNREKYSIFNTLKQEFNDKYREKMNEFLGTNDEELDFSFIDKFCDSFITSYSDKRELTEFKKTGLNFEELESFCHEYYKNMYVYQYSGDEERLLPHVESSKLMSEFIYYMKKRIDADINNENIDELFKDYSRPKMVMLSGHDTTLIAHEMFLIDALELSNDYFRLPYFASQMAFEITRDENLNSQKDYSNYFVNYYFDDELIFNISVEDFIEKVEPHIWNDEKINDFCGFDNDSNIIYAFNKDKNDNAKTAYKILMIIFIVFSFLLLVLSIFLGIKLSKMKKL